MPWPTWQHASPANSSRCATPVWARSPATWPACSKQPTGVSSGSRRNCAAPTATIRQTWNGCASAGWRPSRSLRCGWLQARPPGPSSWWKGGDSSASHRLTWAICWPAVCGAARHACSPARRSARTLSSDSVCPPLITPISRWTARSTTPPMRCCTAPATCRRRPKRRTAPRRSGSWRHWSRRWEAARSRSSRAGAPCMTPQTHLPNSSAASGCSVRGATCPTLRSSRRWATTRRPSSAQR